MALCPSNCTTTLIKNPQGACTPIIRDITPSRFVFWPCNVELPDPITSENILPFFEDGSMVVSSETAEIVFAAPTFEEIRVSQCRPALRRISTREVTFRDLIAVTGVTGSPAASTDFFDYAFWQDKVDAGNRLYYGIAFCNGDVRLARNQDGSFMTADMTAFLDYINPTNGGSSTEFKSLSIRFQGDPLALWNTPEFNLITAGVVL